MHAETGTKIRMEAMRLFGTGEVPFVHLYDAIAGPVADAEEAVVEVANISQYYRDRLKLADELEALVRAAIANEKCSPESTLYNDRVEDRTSVRPGVA